MAWFIWFKTLYIALNCSFFFGQHFDAADIVRYITLFHHNQWSYHQCMIYSSDGFGLRPELWANYFTRPVFSSHIWCWARGFLACCPIRHCYIQCCIPRRVIIATSQCIGAESLARRQHSIILFGNIIILKLIRHGFPHRILTNVTSTTINAISVSEY